MGTRMRRWLLLALLLLPLAACRRGAKEPAWEVVSVERGPIAARVTAVGNLQAQRQVQLLALAAGRVTEVRVQPGDRVEAGELLIQLDDADAQLAVRQAEVALRQAELNLERLTQGASEAEVAAAQAALKQAEANLRRLKEGPLPEELAAARAAVESARLNLEQTQRQTADAVERARLSLEQAANNLRNAQDRYSQVYWDNRQLEERGFELTDAQKQAETEAWRAVQNAEAEMEKARLAYEEALASQEAQVRAAEQQLRQAEANLKKLQQPALPEEIAAAEAQVEEARLRLAALTGDADPRDLEQARLQVEQARIGLEQARRQLEKTRVTAPFAGVVAQVLVEEGQWIGTGTPVLVLQDVSRLYTVVEVDEIDIGRVAPGQAAELTFDALPDRPLEGRVVRIYPQPGQSGGVVTYPVEVELTETDPVLRPGMTVNVAIRVQEKANALLIPRRAVEYEGGRPYVWRVLGKGRDGAPRREKVYVTLGLRNEAQVEVLEGLQEGDRVAVRPLESSLDLFSGPPRGRR